VKNNQIVLEPEEEEISLNSMVSKINSDNQHSEMDWADAHG
jgi:antitoxin component of MazEF toxin-antitoxin module